MTTILIDGGKFQIILMNWSKKLSILCRNPENIFWSKTKTD